MYYIVLFLTIVKLHVAWTGLRIIEGRDASDSEFLYVARLEAVTLKPSSRRRLDRVTFCTGSVLSATWTLTAAHCIHFLEKYTKNNPGLYKYFVRIGNHSDLPSISSNHPDDQQFEILSVHKHPAYKGLIIDENIFIENDVGLLNTASVTLKEFPKISAVDYSSVSGHEALAVGYGINVVITKKDGPLPPTRRSLKVLDLVVVKCPKMGHMYPALCVAHRCGRAPTLCGGDSGGPLLHPSGIIAVASVNEARNCLVEGKQRNDVVGVWTAISPYITWITRHILENNMT